MADQGQTSFSLSTNEVDHSSSSSSSDKCASAADARHFEEIAIVYTTKLDDMDVFNRSLECFSLNDITNCIVRESKPDTKNIVHHSLRTENTASYERVLKKIEEFNENSSLKIVSPNENKCTSLSHDSHISNKKETDKLHNNNHSNDNILETNTHHTLSKMHENNKDIENGTVKNPSSCINNLSSDEDLLVSNGDKMLTKSSGVKLVTESRNIARRKRKNKNNRRKAIPNISDATNPASFVGLSSDEDVVILNDDKILTSLTGTHSSKKSRVSIIDDNSDTKHNDIDDDEPLIRLKHNKQISDKLQECKQLSIDLEDIAFRKRTLRMKPHNGAGFLYCGEWFSLSKLSSADLKRKIRNVNLFFHDKCTQMIDVYTIEDGHVTEHMKINSKINTVILKNYFNSKETIEIECHCWYEREQANLKALELGILTKNNVMFMKQSHNCEHSRCACCCSSSTQNCEENYEMQTSQEEVWSVAEHNDWIRCLKSKVGDAAFLINKCLTYDRFNSNEKKLATFSSIVQNKSMRKSSFKIYIDKIEAERMNDDVPKRTIPTDSPELSVSQKVKNVAELMDSLITKTVCSPRTNSLEQESATINDAITEIERNKDFVSSKIPDNSSSVSQCDNISAEKDNLGVDSLITTILERFQGVRLAINEKGKVTASLNMQINTLSVTEIEVLSKILTQVQQQVDALGLVPGKNVEYFNTDKCSFGQSINTTDSLQSSNHNPVVIDKTSPSFNFKFITSDNVPCTRQDAVSLEAVRNKLKFNNCTLEQITDNGRQSNNDSQVSMDEIILSDDENHSKSSNIIESSEADMSNDFYKMFSSVERSRSDCYRKSFLTLTCKVPGNTSDSEHPESRFVPLVANKSKRESAQITNRHKTCNDRPGMVMMDKAILSNHDYVLASDIPPCSSRGLLSTDKVGKIYEKLAKIAMKRNICYRKSLAAFHSKSSAYFSTSDSSSKISKYAQRTARREVVPSKKRKTVTDRSSKTGKKQNPSEPNIIMNRSHGNRRLEVFPLASSSKDPKKLSHQESAPATADLAISDSVVSLALHEEVDIKPEVVHISDGISDDLDNEDWERAIKEEEEKIAQQVEIIANVNFGNE